jgi:hypothetical protein
MHLVFSIPYSAMSRPRALHSRIWINGMRRCMARSASGNRIALLRFGALWEQDRGRFQDGKRRGLMAIGTSRSLSAARHQRHAMRKEGEAVRLVKRAWRMGYRGVAGALAVAWDTSLSPRRAHAHKSAAPWRCRRTFLLGCPRQDRKGGDRYLSKRTQRVLDAYISSSSCSTWWSTVILPFSVP